MVEIGGRPILWHIMKIYAHYGFHEFVLCLGYRGSVIKEYFLNYEAMNNDFTMRLGEKSQIQCHGHHPEEGFKVTLADTGLESMTGGRIRRVKKYIAGDTFMLTYGDGVSDVNLRRVLEFHKSHGRIATVTTVSPLSRFGVLEVAGEGRVTNFKEKPQSEGAVSAGYFVFNRAIFDYLDGDECVLERGPMERLTAEGQLMAFPHEGFFYAMDTYREYQHLNDLWNRQAAPWKLWDDFPALAPRLVNSR
jgi:glucose-1-phosphate cytidylyltransferase